MRFSVIFVFALFVLAAFLGQSEAAPKWKGWKKIERAGKRVFKAAEKALPVATAIGVIGRK
uniref:Antimicrobial peptide cecropin A n=1 Tax=Calomera littoralis TaxID=285225 RepID=A0A6G6C430_CALLO|nr:antimicrobial peptide cecropin A [Calomera littoralis]